MDGQTLIVIAVIIAAAFYVGQKLWPTGTKQPGCSMCPQNRNRADDYV